MAGLRFVALALFALAGCTMAAHHTIMFEQASNKFAAVNANPQAVCSSIVDGNIKVPSGYNSYCVAVGTPQTPAKERLPAYFSLVNAVTNLPKASFFALPAAESPAAREQVIGKFNARKNLEMDPVKKEKMKEPNAEDYNLGWGRPAWPKWGAVAEAPFTYSPDPGRDYVLNAGAYNLAAPGAIADAYLIGTDGARGHMAANAFWTPDFASKNAGHRGLSDATFLTGVNTFPSFKATPSDWDGRMWNNREVALITYVNKVGGVNTVKVVVGTGGEPLWYLRGDNPAGAIPAEPRENLIDVPSWAWTALYDTKHHRGVAWKCKVLKDVSVTAVQHRPCVYTSIKDIHDTFGVNPFPSLKPDNVIYTNDKIKPFADFAGNWGPEDGKDGDLWW